MLLSTGDMPMYAAAKELEATPGTKWHYSSGTSNIIARIIRNVLANDRDTGPSRAAPVRSSRHDGACWRRTGGNVRGLLLHVCDGARLARFACSTCRMASGTVNRILP